MCWLMSCGTDALQIQYHDESTPAFCGGDLLESDSAERLLDEDEACPLLPLVLAVSLTTAMALTMLSAYEGTNTDETMQQH